MIEWVIPGTGWNTWSSYSATWTLAAIPTPTDTATFSRSERWSNGTYGSTEAGPNGSSTTSSGVATRYIQTSTTETYEAGYAATELTEIEVTVPSTTLSDGTTVTTEYVSSASFPQSVAATFERTTTVTTELTATEFLNGADQTIFQAVGNEALWVLPISSVSSFAQESIATDYATTATRTTVAELLVTTSVGEGAQQTFTNPAITSNAVSFQNTTRSASQVTSTSGFSGTLPQQTQTRTVHVQTTTNQQSDRFSVPSETFTAFGTITRLRSSTIPATYQASYQFGTYSGLIASTTSWIDCAGYSAIRASSGIVATGPNFVITAAFDWDGQIPVPYAAQRVENATEFQQLSAFGNLAFVIGAHSGIGIQANHAVPFLTARANERVAGNYPRSSAIFPTTASNASNGTTSSVSWSSQSYTLTTQNSSTSESVTGEASVLQSVIPAFTEFGLPNAAYTGGCPPLGVTMAFDAGRQLARVGSQTSMISGQTTWSNCQPIATVEPLSSIVLDTVFVDGRNALVWAETKYYGDSGLFSPPQF